MFSRIGTKKSTGDYLDNIKKLKEALAEADAVIIGAGAGLSTAAGYTYSGERFEKYFGDFSHGYLCRSPNSFNLIREIVCTISRKVPRTKCFGMGDYFDNSARSTSNDRRIKFEWFKLYCGNP